jgi:voltage-gated potassium channel
MKYFTWTQHRKDPEKMGWFRLFLFTLESQFVLSTMFGWIALDMLLKEFRREGAIRLEEVVARLDAAVVKAALICALACAGLAFVLHSLRIRRYIKRGAAASEIRAARRIQWTSATVGALCGILTPLYVLVPWTMFPLLAVALVLVVIYIRAFLRRATEILRPGNYGHWSDVAQLLFVYLNLLVVFTLVTLVLQAGTRLLTDLPEKEIVKILPYGDQVGSILDAVYFSVVVMTTLGFGDITPKTNFAQIVVIVQTVAGYVIFGLMIGILTRGIAVEDPDSP